MSEKKSDELFFYDEIYEIKSIYLSIIRGLSRSIEHDLYIKHFTELEKIEIIQKRQEILEITLLKGVKTNKEALDYLISENLWSQEKEEEIARLELAIEDNTRQASNIIIPSQKNVVMGLVGKNKEDLEKIKNERDFLLGLTAEKYADEKYINHYLYFSFYKDEQLKERYFSHEDFKDLEEEEITKYFKIYSKALIPFSQENFKKIAVSPFFLNAASFSYEDSRLFLDKSVLDYTNYQFEIFILGKRNIKVMSESTKNPPIIHSQTKYSDLISWYDLQYAFAENKRKEESGQSQGVKSSLRSHR